MKYHPLTAISPIDGRYRTKTEILAGYFSEYALIKYRVRVEIEYFIALAEEGIGPLKKVDKNRFDELRRIYRDFSLEDAVQVKEIEKTTNHDVKAVEYFVKQKWEQYGLGEYKEWIHFALTSQDINNTAVPLSLKEYLPVYLEDLNGILNKLDAYATQWQDIPMLARTHGQPASPTSLGKEIQVFAERIRQQLKLLKQIPVPAKFGGATGNFNAHQVAFPQMDWLAFARQFVEKKLGLHYSFPTTQIEHYDHLAGLFDAFKRINTILLDLCRDMWTYISMDYFNQKINSREVGSSAMPHKVNPIDFENAEGNLGLANALFEHLSSKLPVSRLQRDLTDSTVLRNIGVPLAHTRIAMLSLQKGLDKLMVNQQKIHDDLEAHWEVVAEAIQTVLRRENFPEPYEKLKEFARSGEKITREIIHNFIDSLDISLRLKDELKKITPFNYTGISRKSQ